MKVRAIINFNDLQENKKRVIGEEFDCDLERASFLLDNKAVETVEVIEEIKEEPKVEIREIAIEIPKKKKKTGKK